MGPSCLLVGGLPSAAQPPPGQLLGSPGAFLPCLDPPLPWGHLALHPWAPSSCSFPPAPLGGPFPQHPQGCRPRPLLRPQQLRGALEVLCRVPGGSRQLVGASLHHSWALLVLAAWPGRERAPQGCCHATSHPASPLHHLTLLTSSGFALSFCFAAVGFSFAVPVGEGVVDDPKQGPLRGAGAARGSRWHHQPFTSLSRTRCRGLGGLGGPFPSRLWGLSFVRIRLARRLLWPQLLGG